MMLLFKLYCNFVLRCVCGLRVIVWVISFVIVLLLVTLTYRCFVVFV